MKATLSLLAFAGSALAGNLVRWGGGGDQTETVTMTTFTTVTTCPVTQTSTEKGT
jgi:hypothetical protein